VQYLGPCLSLDQLVIDIHRLTGLIVILGGLLLGSLLIQVTVRASGTGNGR